MRCPVCGGRMLYDPKHDEYYCSVCGHVVEAYTPHPGRPTEDEIGFYTGKSYQSVDLNLGGTISPKELSQILKGRNVWTRSKKYILSSYETKTFRENMNYMQMIINNLKWDKGYKITDNFDEEYSVLVSRITLRFEHEQLSKKEEEKHDDLLELFSEEEEEVESAKNKKEKVMKRRNYNTFYVFLAVLFHLLQNYFLEKHKNEILDDLWDASRMYIRLTNKSRFLKQLLTKYNMLMQYLRDYNRTVQDKLFAVAYRFDVNGEVVEELFNYMFNKYNLSNYSIDNLIFATVFTVGEMFERKNFNHLKSDVYTVSIQKIVNQLSVLIKREGLTVKDGVLCFTTRRKKVRGRKRKKRKKISDEPIGEEILNTKLSEVVVNDKISVLINQLNQQNNTK